MNRSTSLIEIAIEPSLADREPLLAWLERNLDGADELEFSVGAVSGQILLGGRSETALDKLIGEMKRDGLNAHIGTPQVAYRETIAVPATVDFVHKKQFGGQAEFGRLKLDLAPTGTVKECEVAVLRTSDILPAHLLAGATRGLDTVFAAGILAGFPVVGLTASILDAAYHEIDSTPRTFEVTARAAARECLQKGCSTLLEPWMTIEVRGPGSERLIADLKARRAEVAIDPDGVVRGHVPLAGMFGYANTLRSMTQGLGAWSMYFANYRTVARTFDDDGPFAPAAAMRA